MAPILERTTIAASHKSALHEAEAGSRALHGAGYLLPVSLGDLVIVPSRGPNRPGSHRDQSLDTRETAPYIPENGFGPGGSKNVNIGQVRQPKCFRAVPVGSVTAAGAPVRLLLTPPSGRMGAVGPTRMVRPPAIRCSERSGPANPVPAEHGHAT